MEASTFSTLRSTLDLGNRSAHVSNYTVIRVPYPRVAANACAFEELLPSVLCPLPGLYIDVLLTYLTFFPQPDQPYRIKVIPVSQFSFVDNSSGDVDSADSTMGLIFNGDADLTTPDVSVRSDRIKRNPHYTRAVYTPQYILVSKQFSHGPPGLGMAELLMAPNGLWTLLFTLIALRWILSRLLTRLFPRAVESETSRAWALRVYVRSRLVLSVIFNIALAAVASYLFLVFTRYRPPIKVVSSVSDLAKGALKGQFKPMTLTQTYMDQVLNPKHPEDWKYDGKADLSIFAKAALTNPPILVNNFSAAEAIMLRDEPGVWPNHVLVADKDLLGRLRTTCGLTHVVDPRYFSVNAIFYRDGINVPLDSIQAGLLRTKMGILESVYFPWKDCGVANGNYTEGSPIKLMQMDGVFRSAGVASFLALLLLLTEVMISYVSSRSWFKSSSCV